MNKKNEYKKGLFRSLGQITSYLIVGIIVFILLLILGVGAEFAEWVTDGAITLKIN